MYNTICVTEITTRKQKTGCGSAWLERLVWDQEVAGSNPVTPIDMISNFQVFVNNFFKFFIKQGYKDSNLEMTESESVALPFGDSPI